MQASLFARLVSWGFFTPAQFLTEVPGGAATLPRMLTTVLVWVGWRVRVGLVHVIAVVPTQAQPSAALGVRPPTVMPLGRVSVTVVVGAQSPLSTFLTLITKAACWPEMGGLGSTVFSIVRSHFLSSSLSFFWLPNVRLTSWLGET